MSKVNNIVRFHDFKTENDLYAKIHEDLETTNRESNGNIYKLHTVQIISPNRALVVMEEDTNLVPVIFLYKHMEGNRYEYEEITLNDLPSDSLIMSMQELQLINETGEVNINDLSYAIDRLEYVIKPTGEKHMRVFVKNNYRESEEM